MLEMLIGIRVRLMGAKMWLDWRSANIQMCAEKQWSRESASPVPAAIGGDSRRAFRFAFPKCQQMKLSCYLCDLLCSWCYESVPMRRSPSAPHLRHRGTLELCCSQCQWFPVSPYLNDPTLSHDSSPECKLYWNHVNHVAHVFHIGNVGMETPCWGKKKISELENWLHLRTFNCVSASFISDSDDTWSFLYLCYINQQLYDDSAHV